MKAKLTEPGRVAVSTQGRDKGVWYAVMTVLDDRRLLLCDGKNRTLAKPKKKQIKHLKPLPMSVAVEGSGGSGGSITDGDILKALKAARDAYETKTEGPRAGAGHQKEECAFVQE